MFDALKVRLSQGTQYVRDVRGAVPRGFRGRPQLAAAPCEPAGCSACAEVCPTAALSLAPVRLDLGRCIFCSECVAACPTSKLAFTSEVRMAGATPESLVVAEGQGPSPVAVSEALRRLFGRSLKLRSVSSGGCNGCELELNAMANVNFDFGRYGIDWVASPRHADALVLSGPLTRNMSEALELAWAGMPEPRFVIAFGACAISGGPFAPSSALDRGFPERFRPQLYVPGCPPHPLTFLHGLLDVLGLELGPSAPPAPAQPERRRGPVPGVEPWAAREKEG